MGKSQSGALFTSYNSRELFGLRVLKNNHKYVRRLRKEVGYPSHHGNKVWNSSIVLMDYLRKNPPRKRAKVLEIGCGWAITAIYCARQFNSRITGLDIDPSVFPFAELHASINDVNIETVGKSYQRADAKFLQQFDLVIGGDICFWDELSKPLYNLTRRAVKEGVRVVMADPGRPPFTEMAERACDKLDAKLVAHAVGRPYEVSGWVLDTKN